MNSPELWLPSQDQGIQYSSMKEQEAAHKVPLLVENLQAVDSYQEVRKSVFSSVWSLVGYLCYGGQHHTYLDVKNILGTQWESHVD